MSSFVIRYFDLQARAEIVKAILTFVGADWKVEHPVWPEEKANQPSGTLPVMIETKPDGTQFVLSDAAAIEFYLLKKYNIIGQESNEQEARQLQLRNQVLDACFQGWMYQFGPEEIRTYAKGNFAVLTKMVVEYHEKILKENGSNGHYFGDKVGYADIAIYAGFGALKAIDGIKETALELFSEENAPLINKVFKAVENEPKLAKYVASCK
ncbi:hypothetical protein H4R99_003591 [Coemansia sp. RSA 1722]|nr:hypothetical protein LPJ57_004597 [Coemansia sp. RSA 486]KAJ2599742.1 hypothetical protein H4R99_003591 [Coemansia sp. RSA 1722]